MPPPGQPAFKTLFFDAYGTIFDLDSLVPACNLAFPGLGPEICRLWRIKQLEYTHLLSLMGRFEDFWQVTHKALVFACQSLRLDCPAELRDQLLEGYFQVNAFPDAAPALEALSRQYPLVILSNGTPKMLRMELEHNRLEGFFTQIISASEVGAFKPHLQLYQWGCQKLGLEPAQAGLVSGNAWDVNGGKAFGLWAAWINRAGAPWEDLGFSPDVTAANLKELPPLLGISL